MLQSMKRIQVVGPKTDLEHTVNILYDAGTLHIENASSLVSPDEIALTQFRQQETNEVANVISTISAIYSTLPVLVDDAKAQQTIRSSLVLKSVPDLVSHAHNVIEALETTTKDLASQKTELALLITNLDRYEKVLDIIQPVEKELPALEGFEVTILLIQKEHQDVTDVIKKEIDTITGNRFEMIATTVDSDTLAAIMVFPKKYSEEIHSFIYSVNVNEVRLPIEYSGKPFYEIFALIEERRLKATETIARIDTDLMTLSKQWYQELTVLQELLRNFYTSISVYQNFGLSDYTFVIMGWIPKKYLDPARRRLDTEFSGRVVIVDLPLSEKDLDTAPVFFDNPTWIKPFEIIMQLVAPPKYREVDPTPILAIFFPIFFGIMVGDIGYGLLILLFALLIRYRFESIEFAKSLANILLISSVPSIIFGFLFGEFFGDLGEHMGWLAPIHIFGITWNRIDAMIPLLIVAISIGIIHVFLGLSIGIRNAIITKKRKHLYEKSGMLMMVTAIIILIAELAKVIPANSVYPAVVLIVVALPLIIMGAGIFGTIEVMSTIGNILSYSRLMAIGMASVILAMVANRLSGAFSFAILGIVIALSLHTLNLALAMFSPSIHSVRLHLVEFFSKFYEGGGIPYKPFRRES